MQKRFDFTPPEQKEAPSEKPFEPDEVLSSWLSSQKEDDIGERKEVGLAEEAIRYGDKRSLKELLALHTRDLEDLVYEYRRKNQRNLKSVNQ